LHGFAIEHPGSGAGHILLAEVLRRQEKLEEAESHIEKGLALLPTQGSAYYVHARILAKKLEQLATQGGAMGKLKAMKQIGPYRSALQTAIELDPKNVDARKEEILFYLFTPGIGDKEVAIEKARELRSVHAMEGDLSLARALYYSDKKANAEVALKQVRAAIDEYPEVNDPNWILGSILFDEKRYDEADVALAKVIDSEVKNETYYQALYRRMRVRTRANRDSEEVLAYVDEFLEAIRCWEWAPRLHQVYCERGRALATLGRGADARVAFEKSLKLMPGYERAERGLEGL